MSRFLPILVLTALVSACATTGRSGGFGRAPDETIVFPTPPDTARVQFLFAATTSADVGTAKGGLLDAFFDENPDGFSLIKPYGVDYREGRIYVCDSMLPGVNILDMHSLEFTPWIPRGDGKLRKPINCTIDPEDGRLYVTDTERRQVVVFDESLGYVGAFGGEEEGVPVDVQVTEDRLWVADLAGQRVRVYDKASWDPVGEFPDYEGEVEAPLRQPTNLTVSDSRVYVSDFGDFNVKQYDVDGSHVRTLGSYGRNLGQFTRPKGVALSRDGNLFVVDAGFQNVQVFDPDGELLMYFGGGYSGPGTMWLPADVRIVHDDLEPFAEYVDPRFDLEYVILVTNQYGPDRLTAYGFVTPRAGPG